MSGQILQEKRDQCIDVLFVLSRTFRLVWLANTVFTPLITAGEVFLRLDRVLDKFPSPRS